MQPFQIVLRGHVTPADKAHDDYYYLPFDLPLPARELRIRYTYSAPMSSDQVEGGNVIDIGLFDPAGAGFPGARGFRGWSGSARQEFTIGRREATPGYLPGPLPAGRYQVILGLYRIWEQGADYRVEIWADRLDAASAAPVPASDAQPEPQLAERAAGLWLRGDLQSHTFHSDAKGSPEQLVAKARALGLDFLAITDHNTVSHHRALARLAGDDPLLIPGQEATTYYGHMNIWGTSHWCDFRARSDPDMAAIVELAHRHGAVCSINHPKQGGPAWEYSLDLPVDAMEVWQGPWPHRNAESLALWDRLLSQGRRLPAVGGSDYHCPAAEETHLLRLGQPTTWVQVTERSVSGILDAIRRGRACISASPAGPRLSIEASAGARTAAMGEVLPRAPGDGVTLRCHVLDGDGYTLRVIADGEVVDETLVAGSSHTHSMTIAADHYVRGELVADLPPDRLPPGAPAGLDLREWRWALSNPVFIGAVC